MITEKQIATHIESHLAGVRLVRLVCSAALACLLLAGCSKELPDPGTGMPGDGIIRLNASIAEEEGTKAPVIDGGAGSKAVLSRLRILKKDGASMVTDFSGVTAVEANRDASGAITLIAEGHAQYMRYSKMDTKAWLVAYHPFNGTLVNANWIQWSIDGKTDILLSTLDPAKSYDAGKYSAPVTGTLMLYHALAQLEVKIIADNSVNPATVRDTWGKITKIELLSSAQKMTYTHATNALTYDAAGALPLLHTDYETAFVDVSLSNGVQTVAAGMYPPSTGPIRLKVYSEKVIGGAEVAVQLKDGGSNTNFQAGKHYVVTLTFGANDKQIGVTSTVAAWQQGYTAENKPAWTPKVGSYYYTDGTISWDILAGKTVEGVIYWVDSADPFHFKIAALNEPPASWKTYGNEAGKLKWSITATAVGSGTYAPSIVVASGIDGVGRKNGLANQKVIRKYCVENTSGHTLTTYPAARWCEEMRVDGRGGWVVPSIDELDHLYCAYSGNTPSKWLTGSGPAAQTGYPEAFDVRFTAVAGGGKSLTYTNNLFMSSTMSSASSYYYLNFGAQGNQGSGSIPSTACNVRCIKEFPVREDPPRLLPSDGVLDMASGNTISSGAIHDATVYTLVSTTNSYNGYTYNASNANNNGGYKSNKATVLAEPVYHKLEVAKADETAAPGTTGWSTDGTATWPTAWAACKAKAPAGAWRLPRESEWAWIYMNKTELAKTPGSTVYNAAYYWSGTENGTNAAWYLTFSSSSISPTSKIELSNLVIGVRCVREL